MTAHTDPKALIITLLKNNILVYEDGNGTQITGVVAGTWYDKQILGADKWMVTVGPTIGGDLAPDDVGANTWNLKNTLVVNIWVPVLENANYTPERLRFSIKEEIKRLLKAKLVDPVGDVRFLHLSSWRDLDDRENDMLRVECTVQVEWYE